MLIIYMMMMSIFMFILGNMIFCSMYKHLLIVLLSLEFLVLSMFMFIYMIYLYMEYELFFLIIYLVFSVCEGALGLSILVMMIRTYGNDYLQIYNLL